ncbi:MAG: hypothetical protein WDW36_000129 [Sanguina aurantia]
MVLVYGLPLVAAQLSPPPADTSALYSPTGAKGASVASIIQYATYVLAAIALSVIAGSLAAGRALCACLGLRQLNAFFLMLWGVDILGQFAFHGSIPAFPRPPRLLQPNPSQDSRNPSITLCPSTSLAAAGALVQPPQSAHPLSPPPAAPAALCHHASKTPRGSPSPARPSAPPALFLPPRVDRTNVASLLIAVAFIIAHIGLLIGLHWQLRLVTSAPDNRCAIFGDPRRPTVCSSLRPEPEMCGSDRAQALQWLTALEQTALALAGTAFGVTAAAGAAPAAASASPVGSTNVTVADPTVPRPPGTPCVVPLFSAVTFNDFSPRPYAYAPPANCGTRWSKVLLEADFSVNAGRQFDRTATIFLGGVNLYFGTTQEPSSTVAPHWHVERDLTDYSALLRQSGNGQALIGNVVDSTYTGVITGSARLLFYPASLLAPAAHAPDAVVPLGTDPVGSTTSLATPASQLTRSLSLPTNVERAYLDVFVQSQNADEFWYTCVPDAYAAEGIAYALLIRERPPAAATPLAPTATLEPPGIQEVPDRATTGSSSSAASTAAAAAARSAPPRGSSSTTTNTTPARAPANGGHGDRSSSQQRPLPGVGRDAVSFLAARGSALPGGAGAPASLLTQNSGWQQLEPSPLASSRRPSSASSASARQLLRNLTQGGLQIPEQSIFPPQRDEAPSTAPPRAALHHQEHEQQRPQRRSSASLSPPLDLAPPQLLQRQGSGCDDQQRQQQEQPQQGMSATLPRTPSSSQWASPSPAHSRRSGSFVGSPMHQSPVQKSGLAASHLPTPSGSHRQQLLLSDIVIHDGAADDTAWEPLSHRTSLPSFGSASGSLSARRLAPAGGSPASFGSRAHTPSPAQHLDTPPTEPLFFDNSSAVIVYPLDDFPTPDTTSGSYLEQGCDTVVTIPSTALPRTFSGRKVKPFAPTPAHSPPPTPTPTNHIPSSTSTSARSSIASVPESATSADSAHLPLPPPRLVGVTTPRGTASGGGGGRAPVFPAAAPGVVRSEASSTSAAISEARLWSGGGGGGRHPRGSRSGASDGPGGPMGPVSPRDDLKPPPSPPLQPPLHHLR